MHTFRRHSLPVAATTCSSPAVRAGLAVAAISKLLSTQGHTARPQGAAGDFADTVWDVRQRDEPATLPAPL